MTETAVHDGYDDFLDAVEAGEPYYLEGPDGNGWLPPRAVNPETGDDDLEPQPLPETGTIETTTTTHVGTPSFADDTPYVVAVVAFGPVRVTGQVRDRDPGAVDHGMTVSLAVDRTETTGERILVFEPVE